MNTLKWLALLSLLLLFQPLSAAFAGAPVVVKSEQKVDLSRKAVEKQLGRKLKFKERIVLGMTRGKAKRMEKRAAKGQVDERKQEGFAIASFVCGLFSWLLIPFLPAIVFGIISLAKFSREPGKYKGVGFAIAGLVLAVVFLLVGAIVALSNIVFSF